MVDCLTPGISGWNRENRAYGFRNDRWAIRRRSREVRSISHGNRTLLEAAGSRFRYDFEIGRALKSEAGHEINRLFVIQFPDRASKGRVFADSIYLEIRARLFEYAVKGTAIIAEYAS